MAQAALKFAFEFNHLKVLIIKHYPDKVEGRAVGRLQSQINLFSLAWIQHQEHLSNPKTRGHL